VKVLEGLLTKEGDEIQNYALGAIGQIGGLAVTAKILAELARLVAKTSSFTTRQDVLRTLDKLGIIASSPEIFATVKHLAMTPGEHRTDALKTLVSLTHEGVTSETLSVLEQSLEDQDSKVRAIAQKIVAKLGTAAATPRVRDALQRDRTEGS
jgi:hypothetical protein